MRLRGATAQSAPTTGIIDDRSRVRPDSAVDLDLVRATLERFRARLAANRRSADADWIGALRELDRLRPPSDGDGGLAKRPGRLMDGSLASGPCNEETMRSPAFAGWLARMGLDPGHMHRKHWEWAFVAQALEERGMLRPGRSGLGFAVGREPLASLFASRGARILATDVGIDRMSTRGWIDSGQHAASLANLFKPDLLSETEFVKLVGFRPVDMRELPGDIGGFDFHWSACAFEHLGSLRAGMDFVLASYERLGPGGVAVHTTEYNLDSDWATVGEGDDVLYRRSDLEAIADRIRRSGGRVTLDFREGSLPADLVVDRPPYNGSPHLRLELFGYRCTSFGLILEKP